MIHVVFLVNWPILLFWFGHLANLQIGGGGSIEMNTELAASVLNCSVYIIERCFS